MLVGVSSIRTKITVMSLIIMLSISISISIGIGLFNTTKLEAFETISEKGDSVEGSKEDKLEYKEIQVKSGEEIPIIDLNKYLKDNKDYTKGSFYILYNKGVPSNFSRVEKFKYIRANWVKLEDKTELDWIQIKEDKQSYQLSGVPNTPGKYILTLGWLDETNVGKEINPITLTVEVKNNVPSMVLEDIAVNVGKTDFDIYSKIYYTDVEDSEDVLKTKLEVVDTGGFDISKPNIYKVEYKLTDSHNDSVYGERNIRVYNKKPKIVLSNNIINKGDTEFTLKDNIYVKDNEDGDITSRVEILPNNFNINETGIYLIKYKVSDSNNKESFGQRYIVVSPIYLTTNLFLIHSIFLGVITTLTITCIRREVGNPED